MNEVSKQSLFSTDGRNDQLENIPRTVLVQNALCKNYREVHVIFLYLPMSKAGENF